MAKTLAKQKPLLGDVEIRQKHGLLAGAIYSRISYYIDYYTSKNNAERIHICEDGHKWLVMTQEEFGKRLGRSEQQIQVKLKPLISDGLVLTLKIKKHLFYRINTSSHPVDKSVEKPVDKFNETGLVLTQKESPAFSPEEPYFSTDTEEKLVPVKHPVDNHKNRGETSVDQLEEKTPGLKISDEPIEKQGDSEKKPGFSINPDITLVFQGTRGETRGETRVEDIIYDIGIDKSLSTKGSLNLYPLKSPSLSEDPTPSGEGRVDGLAPPPPGSLPQAAVTGVAVVEVLSTKVEEALRGSREGMEFKLVRRRLAWALPEVEYFAWLHGCRIVKNEEGWLLIFDTWFKADHVADHYGVSVVASLSAIAGHPAKLLCLGPKGDPRREQRVRTWIGTQAVMTEPTQRENLDHEFEKLKALLPSKKNQAPRPLDRSHLDALSTAKEREYIQRHLAKDTQQHYEAWKPSVKFVGQYSLPPRSERPEVGNLLGYLTGTLNDIECEPVKGATAADLRVDVKS